jgi:hypothetical protein
MAAAGADPLEDEVAGDLEQAVAEEEESRAKPVLSGAQAQIALQLGGREADIHAIDVGDDVADEGEGDETPPDPLQDPVRDRYGSGFTVQGVKAKAGSLSLRKGLA